jgi:glutamate racemase
VNLSPIGVFDSGIGGLTVARELMRQLPHESLIYFGDTARVPWGNKSADTVRRYSREIFDFLVARGVKLVVVACNTASAHALESLARQGSVPVEGVIEPGARAAVGATRNGRIGVIGTVGTVRSGAYARAIRSFDGAAEVVERACPLLVPIVEEGWLDHQATKLITREYVLPLLSHGIDTLVLGCTHYPLLKPLLGEVMGPGVTLIDSAEQTAASVAQALAASTLHAPTDAPGGLHLVVSDAPEQFEKLAARFLGRELPELEVVALGD